MPRPEFVTDKDIVRWSDNIDNDPNLNSTMRNNPIIREVCYAGLWLSESLEKAGCPEFLMGRILWTAGKLSYGRDIWEVHQDILEKFKNNELNFEEDPNEVKN